MLDIRRRFQQGLHLLLAQDERKFAARLLVRNTLDVQVLLESNAIKEPKSGNGLVENSPGYLAFSRQVELIPVDIVYGEIVWRPLEVTNKLLHATEVALLRAGAETTNLKISLHHVSEYTHEVLLLKGNLPNMSPDTGAKEDYNGQILRMECL
jgi:hypothetical protein